MRSREKQKQDVWFCEFEETNIGMDRVRIYGKPIHYLFTVSATTGQPYLYGAGLSMQYDRYITSFDRKARDVIKEGMAVFVDRIPVLDKNKELVVNKTFLADASGELILDDEDEPILTKIEYETEPDYIVEKIYDTLKGKVARYGIKKV